LIFGKLFLAKLFLIKYLPYVGMGLTIALEIDEAHSGLIRAESPRSEQEFIFTFMLLKG